MFGLRAIYLLYGGKIDKLEPFWLDLFGDGVERIRFHKNCTSMAAGEAAEPNQFIPYNEIKQSMALFGQMVRRTMYMDQEEKMNTSAWRDQYFGMLVQKVQHDNAYATQVFQSFIDKNNEMDLSFMQLIYLYVVKELQTVWDVYDLGSWCLPWDTETLPQLVAEINKQFSTIDGIKLRKLINFAHQCGMDDSTKTFVQDKHIEHAEEPILVEHVPEHKFQCPVCKLYPVSYIGQMCGHLVCRACSIQSNSEKCRVCKQWTHFSEISMYDDLKLDTGYFEAMRHRIKSQTISHSNFLYMVYRWRSDRIAMGILTIFIEYIKFLNDLVATINLYQRNPRFVFFFLVFFHTYCGGGVFFWFFVYQRLKIAFNKHF